MTLKKIAVGVCVLCLLLGSFVLPVRADSVSYYGVITDSVSFTDAQSNSISGTVSQYIDDELYSFLEEHLIVSGSPVSSYTLFSSSGSFSSMIDSAEYFIGNSLWYDSASMFIDTMNIDTSLDNLYDDVFNVVDVRASGNSGSQSKSGEKVVKPPVAYDYYFSYNELSSRASAVDISSGGSSVNFGNFWPNTITAYTYYAGFPFGNLLLYNGSVVMYMFSVYPSSAYSSGHFDFSGLNTYTSGSNTYYFVPIVEIVGSISDDTASVVVMNMGLKTSDFASGSSYLDSSTYSYYTSSGSFTASLTAYSSGGSGGSGGESGGSGGESGGSGEAGCSCPDYSARLDTIIQNQNTHTGLLNAIITWLSNIYNAISQLVANSAQQNAIDDQNDASDSLNDDIDDFEDSESGYTDDLSSGFDDISSDFDNISDSIGDNASGSSWLANTAQSFYENSGDLQPAFLLPLAFGFIALFLGG